MTKKKAVKIRKWFTCVEPGCKRRARANEVLCGEHLKEFNERKKAAATARRKQTSAEVRKKLKRDSEAKRKRKPTKREAFLKKKAKEEKKKQKLQDGYSRAVGKARVSVDAAAKTKRTPTPGERIITTITGGSRLIKAHCEKCDYTIRLSRKWIEVKRPICPVCMKNMMTALDNETPDPRQLRIKALAKEGV